MAGQQKTSWRLVIRGLMALAVVLLMALGFASALVWIIQRTFSGLNPEFAAALLAASGTVVAATAAVAMGRYYERKQDIEQTRRLQQIEIFDDFIEFMFRVLYDSRLPGSDLTEGEMLAEFVRFTRRLAIWAPDSIIEAWSDVRRRLAAAGSAGQPSTEALFDFEAFLIDLRKTVGYPNTQLGRGDLLRLFVDDIDEHLGTTDPADV